MPALGEGPEFGECTWNRYQDIGESQHIGIGPGRYIVRRSAGYQAGNG
jgi:hypothetical protein